jgi:transposase
LPARAYRPRDKALVENAVRIIYTRIYVKVRRQEYFTLSEINAAIMLALEKHNNASLRGRNYSRRQQFTNIEKDALMPLPPLRYEIRKHQYAKVAKNGHVCLNEDMHYYSVPFKLIGRKVKLLYSRTSVEVYYNYERMALHLRILAPYRYTTQKDHLASAHRFISEWTPEKFISWAAGIDPDVELYIGKVLQAKQHPEQAYKSCAGILSLANKIGKDRLIRACQRAHGYEAYNYKTIETILKRELDLNKAPEQTDHLKMPAHDNIRGENYYK